MRAHFKESEDDATKIFILSEVDRFEPKNYVVHCGVILNYCVPFRCFGMMVMLKERIDFILFGNQRKHRMLLLSDIIEKPSLSSTTTHHFVICQRAPFVILIYFSKRRIGIDSPGSCFPGSQTPSPQLLPCDQTMFLLPQPLKSSGHSCERDASDRCLPTDSNTYVSLAVNHPYDTFCSLIIKRGLL